MNDLLGLLTDQIQKNPGVVDMISNQIGGNSQQTQSAIAQFLPIVTNALANNAQSESGAASLFNALQKDHSGGIGDIASLLMSGQQSQGSSILSHIFGPQQNKVQDFISQSSGLSGGQTSSLIQTLAPLVMKFIGGNTAQSGGGITDLVGLLTNSRDNVRQSDPRNAGMIESLLDQNNDGNVVDDIAKIGVNFLLKNWMSGRG